MDAEEPRWLDEAERAAWIAFVSMTARMGPALDAQLRRDSGLGHFEYQVLSRLSESPARTRRMRELAILADGSLSRLSMAVSRMERRGWIRRDADPTDGRTTLAVLTDAGWDVVVAAAPGHVAEVRRLVLDPLTDAQVGQLTRIGRRINAALDTAVGRPEWTGPLEI